jgi:ABC-type Mn2+/Zn2+ transport system ATPase subunit
VSDELEDIAVEPAVAHPGQALCMHGLTASYGDVVALEEIDLEVPYGASVAVLGPNGAGKSSLFAAAVGLLRPSAGSVGVGDRGVAWLPQQLDVEPTLPLTVEDVVRMGRWGRGRWLRRLGAEDLRRVAAAMSELGIADLAGRSLSSLSGGQRQRALIAQVMAQDAGLILLDEPLTGVDRPTGEAIGNLIARWSDGGRAVMVATHDLESAAHDYDLVIAINRRVIAFGSAAQVCTEEVLRRTFSGHVARLDGEDLVDTSHQHPGAA